MAWGSHLPDLPPGLPRIVDLRGVAVPATGAPSAPVVVAWRRGRVVLVSGAAQITAARRSGRGDVACTIRVPGGAMYRCAALV